MDGIIRNRQLVVLLVALPQTKENLDSFIYGRLTHHHRLEAALEGRIAFDVLAILIERCGTNTLQLTPRQSRLEDICRINRPFGGTGTNEGMHFINHQDDVAGRADFIHDLLKALFKLTPILGTGHKQANIEGNNALITQNIGCIALDDALGQTFGDRGFTHTGLTDQNWIIFGAAPQNLNHALNFALTTDNRIKLVVLGELRQVSAKFVEGRRLGTA